MATIFPQNPRVQALSSTIIYLGVVLLLAAGFPDTLRALAIRATPRAVTVMPGANHEVQLFYTEFEVKDIAVDVPCCWQIQAFDADKMVAASVYRQVFFSGPAARTE